MSCGGCPPPCPQMYCPVPASCCMPLTCAPACPGFCPPRPRGSCCPSYWPPMVYQPPAQKICVIVNNCPSPRPCGNPCCPAFSGGQNNCNNNQNQYNNSGNGGEQCGGQRQNQGYNNQQQNCNQMQNCGRGQQQQPQQQDQQCYPPINVEYVQECCPPSPCPQC